MSVGPYISGLLRVCSICFHSIVAMSAGVPHPGASNAQAFEHAPYGKKEEIK